MPQQARGLETRRTIVRAAAESFVKHGFSGSSLADIATQAGVTKGALYFHFPSKDALAMAMISAQEEANAELTANLASYEGNHLDLLVAMTEQMGQRLIEDPTVRAAMRLAVERGEAKDSAISGTYETWEGLVREIAKKGAERGEIMESVDPGQLARFLVAAFTGVQTVSLVSSGLEDLNERLSDMWSLLRPGLEVSPAE